MPLERLERSVHAFWMMACGYNNRFRDAPLADTPWNQFTKDEKVLVNTLWAGEIIEVYDPVAGHERRFVRMGDYRTDWSPALKAKGKAAMDNLHRASAERCKLIGFEIEPRSAATNPQVKHFYLDRFHRLEWISELRDDHERLRIADAFIEKGFGPPPSIVGNTTEYFELLPWNGPLPGSLGQAASSGASVEAGAPNTAVVVGWPRSGGELVDTVEPLELENELVVDTAAEPPWFAGWGGGESEHHKALKAYVAAHPSLFGAPPDAHAIQEFPLRSGDSIDVVFQTPSAWVAVEVKSKISETVAGDYERGIYQVIKYRAVLKAQASWDNHDSPRQVKVFLALQGKLPPDLWPLARKFSCEVLEDVRPSVEPPIASSLSRTSGHEDPLARRTDCELSSRE